MQSPRWFVALTALCLAGLLGSCSGDDGDDGDADKDASSSPGQGATSADPGDAKTSDAPVGDVTSRCRATVTVTGAVEVSWKGPGSVRTPSQPGADGPKAVYVSAHGGNVVSLYSEGKNFLVSANFATDEVAFTTAPGDETGIDIGPRGKAAEVDADMVGIEEPGVHVVASFDC